ncbi:40S ribosomal protein S19-2 [Bienertia sinuspersici]
MMDYNQLVTGQAKGRTSAGEGRMYTELPTVTDGWFTDLTICYPIADGEGTKVIKMTPPAERSAAPITPEGFLEIELPPWTDIVKTGVLKELAPIDPDWYYIRAGPVTEMFLFNIPLEASMARKIYLRGGLGVGAFRRIHGGSKRNGSHPPHFGKSRSSIARHILQQLEKMIIVEIDPRGGRKITSSGQTDLDQVSGHIGAA